MSSKESKEQIREIVKEILELSLKLKKNPDLYTKEVVRFITLFRELYDSVKDHPAGNNEKFVQVMIFLARVSHFYKEDMQFLVEDLMELLNHFMLTLNPYIRRKVVFGLMMLRRKGMIQPYKCIIFMMKLFNCQDKQLRKVLFKFIIRDIKEQNLKHKNLQLNNQLQNFLIELLKKSADNVAKRSIQILIELYKKNIWNDTKTVNIIANGCFNNNYKVRLLSAYFLISTTEQQEEVVSSSEEENDNPYIVKKGKNKSVKPSKAREHRVEREKKKADRKHRKRLQKQTQINQSFFPLDLIHSPQDYAEKLFNQVKRLQQDKFECKIASMQVISRLINRNKLILIPFYSFFQKYLYPTQKDIAKVMAFLAEAIHDLIPHEELAPIVKQIVEQFINDHCSEQTLSLGIRAVIEMVQKNKTILDQFNLNFIASFTKYKNKNVNNAARQLVNFFRDENPKLLEKKYRGKQWKSKDELEENDNDEDDEKEVKRNDIADCIEGADLLEEELKSKSNQSNNVPIYYDRVLTDEDFKRIRALQRKKENDELIQQQSSYNFKQGMEEEESDSVEDDSQISEISGESSGVESGNEEIESDDGLVEDDWEEVDDKKEEIQSEADTDEEENDDDLIEDLDDREEEGEEEEIPKAKGSNLKEKNKKRKRPLDKLEDEVNEDSVLEYYSSNDEEDSDQNPHGYVDPKKLGYFKKTKTQQKKDKAEAKLTEVKDKKYQYNKKKNEFSSTTNKEKNKNKPLEMLRPKKNRIKNDMISTKKRIKDLKNQLGHVRSVKQARRKTIQQTK